MPFPIVTGVYLTSHGPEKGKTFLSQNNWGGRSQITEKLEAYVKIEMNKFDPPLEDVSEGRDIFLYKSDLDLRGRYPKIELFP